ncbi:MAG: hypothetical protein A3F11_04290 [Gammaproteobacteria bacterium RIFCSPHIGHO2_12_FULL_37_14]|nr:MAG: hypothetical protein A3F11_04290 [Gammaproteobacteria bacterium RIFCSPHIGHO2_12_FULL_37_14]
MPLEEFQTCIENNCHFIVVIVISLLIWRFTPFISVDEVNNRVSIGGGLTQIHDTDIDNEAKKMMKSISQKNTDQTNEKK